MLVVSVTLFSCHNQTNHEIVRNDTVMNVSIEADITYALDDDTARHTIIKYIDIDGIKAPTRIMQKQTTK